MTTENYPELRGESLEDVIEWIEEVTNKRERDVGDFDNISSSYMRGRKVDKIPTAYNDTSTDDREGDFNYDESYFYLAVLDSGTLKWSRQPHSVDTTWKDSFYDETSVAITGGTIDGTVIGGTTAAAGTFTTATADTFITDEVIVADDAATSVSISGGAYVFSHVADNSSAFRAFTYCTTTGSPSIVGEITGSSVDTTTGVLTGTTGVDTRMTVSAAPGAYYLENRLGSSKTCQIVTLGGS